MKFDLDQSRTPYGVQLQEYEYTFFPPKEGPGKKPPKVLHYNSVMSKKGFEVVGTPYQVHSISSFSHSCPVSFQFPFPFPFPSFFSLHPTMNGEAPSPPSTVHSPPVGPEPPPRESPSPFIVHSPPSRVEGGLPIFLLDTRFLRQKGRSRSVKARRERESGFSCFVH